MPRSSARLPKAASPPPGRRDTHLESEGAEFLVLGHLLAEGIEAHKMYTRRPGFDVLAVDPTGGGTCRIQVKSRWSTNAGGFPISRFDCDFVAFVRLNRGYPRPRKDGSLGRRSPEIYVLPIEVVKAAHAVAGWSKVLLSRISDLESYRDRWDLIRSHLERA